MILTLLKLQGMHDVLMPIYFCFATSSVYSEFCEEDSFFCFTNLMSQIMDHFSVHSDDPETTNGITAATIRLDLLLKNVDPTLHRYMHQLNLRAEFYSLRWIMVLLSMDFELPLVLRLWDYLLSAQDITERAIHICCAMLIVQRKELLMSDFDACLSMLQKYPKSAFDKVLCTAIELEKAISGGTGVLLVLNPVTGEPRVAQSPPPKKSKKRTRSLRDSELGFDVLRDTLVFQ